MAVTVRNKSEVLSNLSEETYIEEHWDVWKKA